MRTQHSSNEVSSHREKLRAATPLMCSCAESMKTKAEKHLLILLFAYFYFYFQVLTTHLAHPTHDYNKAAFNLQRRVLQKEETGLVRVRGNGQTSVAHQPLTVMV